MKKRRLPTGIQTFREVRETDCYYVDKTAHVRELVEEGSTGSCRARSGSARACCSTR